jgi:DNA polymerase-3 subunit epsilon
MRKARPGLKSYSLANLTQHFGIEMSRHHRALSDAEAAAELLFIINDTRLKNQRL